MCQCQLCSLWSKSFLIFLFLLLRVYISYSDFHVHSLTTCTAMWLHLLEINSSSVHAYILVCFIRNYYIGLLANNTTWCQNRGCICISSTRRTYGRIHAVSCIHPVIQTTTRTIILWTELFPKERREKIQGEILQRPQSSFQLKSKSVSSVSTCNPVTTTTSLILHTELILLQEIQGSSCAGIFQQLIPMYPSILHNRTRLQAPYSIQGYLETGQVEGEF